MNAPNMTNTKMYNCAEINELQMYEIFLLVRMPRVVQAWEKTQISIKSF